MKEVNYDIVQKLEFDRVQQSILLKAKSALGRTAINALAPFDDPKLLNRALLELNEMINLIRVEGELPLAVSFDLSDYISHALKGGILSPQQFDHIASDIVNAQTLTRFITKLTGAYPLIDNIVSELNDLNQLEQKIRKVILADLSINDHASHNLYKIRQKINNHDAKINKALGQLLNKYGSYLTDNIITLREGHYVLPVKTAAKNKVQGIALSMSDSGATTFIEPDEIMLLNNELARLRGDEMEEVNRLLRALSSEVASYEDEIKQNNEIIGQLDFLHAKALYATETGSITSKISHHKELYLPDARHPLIDPKTVVANTFKLSADERVMVISGPNAGGKTVALKTVGLLVYMHQVGLALPLSDVGEVPFINRMFVDIGDSQSLRDNLSTFSGHLKNLIELTSDLKDDDLVIIDELGTGTDPKEGEALAIAVSDYVLNSGALGLISSHFSGLKNYALATPGVFNASMVFDGEELVPTYQLKLNIPGQSYGLVVAKRLGLNETIIEKAEALIEKTTDQDTSKIYQQLEKEIKTNLALNETLQEEVKTLKDAINKTELSQIKYEKERAKLESEYQAKIEEYLQNAAVKVEEVIEQVKSATKPHQIIAAKQSLAELEISGEEEQSLAEQKEFKVGDQVYLPDMAIYGEVSRIQGNRINLIASNGLSFSVKKRDLRHTTVQTKPKTKITHHVALNEIDTSIGLELNIIGLRVDEALLKVADYLDKARIKNFSTVRIIHGIGSGALKKAVHQYLDQQNFIITYRLGGPGEGGGGATVVTLHE